MINTDYQESTPTAAGGGGDRPSRQSVAGDNAGAGACELVEDSCHTRNSK